MFVYVCSLSVTEINMLKSPILTVDLSSYPFSSVNFLFVYFDIILLHIEIRIALSSPTL